MNSSQQKGREKIGTYIRRSLGVGLIAVFGTLVLVEPTLACVNPTEGIACDQQLLDLESVLSNAVEFASLAALYISYIVVFWGAILWFGIKGENKKTRGKYLIVGGLSLTLLHFSFDTVYGVLRWVGGG